MTPMDEKLQPRLIVVGSSAGGVEALSILVSSLPEDLPAPVVVAQHLDPQRESHLKEILSRRGNLPVRTVTEGDYLEAGVVFVVPSDRHVDITDSEISLEEDAGQPKPSVDRLLSSAAGVMGEGLVAVILTGTGSDGAEGAAAIKRVGGTVIIQNPDTAEYPGMPLSLPPSTVDIVSDVEGIAQVLRNLRKEIPDPEEEGSLESLLEDVREQSGIDFSGYKTGTIMRRLQRRMAATGSKNVEEYHQYLQENSEEFQKLINSFLINVSEFFRDTEMFEYLQEEVIPNLVEKSRDQGNYLRLWSAGCSTGEEVYSLAILVAEVLGEELREFNIRIFATDLDEESVAFARRGVYSRAALTNLSQELVDRYFTRMGNDYQINKVVRGMVVFGEHDLAQRSAFPRIDMVLSRNVLIYFTPELQRRTLQLFAYSLRNGGRLVLGKAESVSPFEEFFTPEHQRLNIFRRRGERFLMPPALLESPAPSSWKRQSGDGSNRPENLSRVQTKREQEAQRLTRATENARARKEQEEQKVDLAVENLLLRLPMGTVMVDRRYDIRLINNVARQLLSIHGSATGEDLIHLIQSSAYTELRPSIDAAFRDETTAEISEFVLEEASTGRPRYLRITVYPRKSKNEDEPPEDVVLLITEVTDLARSREELREQVESMEAELEQHKSLTQRLSETNRELEESNQELNKRNDNLQSSNDELLISTEEAQASTEEVETLNEELQATNEELETLNEELQATVEELNTTNDDLQARSAELQELAQESEEEQVWLTAILESISNAAVTVVDGTGNITFQNTAYKQMFGESDPDFRDEGGNPLSPSATLWRRAAREEAFDGEFTVIAESGGLRRFTVTGNPIEGANQRGGVLLINEVEGGEED
jgi:two-component system CheB/CheR fusion protein